MFKNIYKLNQNSNLLNKYNKQIEINKQQIYFKQTDIIKPKNAFTKLICQFLNIYNNFYFKFYQIKDLLLLLFSNHKLE